MVSAVEAAYYSCPASFLLFDVPLAPVLLLLLWELVFFFAVVVSDAVLVVLHHCLAPLPLSSAALTLAESWLSVYLLDYGLGSVNLVSSAEEASYDHLSTPSPTALPFVYSVSALVLHLW